VHNFFRDEKTQRYVVEFHPKLLELYGGGYTMVDRESRQALGKNNLAKWLQGFYSSHAKPYPMKLATLQKLCGSSEVLKNFKIKVRKALDELVQGGKKPNFAAVPDRRPLPPTTRPGHGWVPVKVTPNSHR
jgi:hypothetical protein